MSSQIIPVEAFDYVVFGGTGDLAERKLLPALYRRFKDGQILETSRIIAAARSDFSNSQYRDFAYNALVNHVKVTERDETTLQAFLKLVFYIPIDAKSAKGWPELKEILGEQDERIRAFYLAVGPSIFGDIAQSLHSYDLIRECSRLVIEKPIGKDMESAKQLNETVGKYFREDQIFRIDHYLGKESVQNLLVLRFANTLYQSIWNASYVDHIQITVGEDLGVEGRGNYYDNSGAIRDMVQNHILQLLCLVAMEPPASSDANSVRDEKLKVLRSLKTIDESNCEKLTVRGQYKTGVINDTSVPAYLDEIDNKDSSTETFVAIKAEIENWRWAGVPFYLRTGKRLAARFSEIVIKFKQVPHNIFDDTVDSRNANRLIIRLQPNDGVKQRITIKDPGPGGMRLRDVDLDMSFAENFDGRPPDAYERLLLDVIRGNQTLFMRRDEVQAAWQWIDPIIAGWQSQDQQTNKYTSGTWGPTASIALIERDGRTWHDEDL